MRQRVNYESWGHFVSDFNEFLLHLKYNPKKYTLIKNRILSYPDITNNQIRSILLNHNSYLAKLILADIEFKEKNIAYKEK